MKKILIILVLLPILLVTVHAEAVEPPALPGKVQEYMPEEHESLGEGIAYIVTVAISKLMPDLAEGCRLGFILLAMGIAVTLVAAYSDMTKKICGLVCVLSTSVLLLSSSQSLITLGIDTVVQLDDYSKLLLPAMTTALASTGAVSKSAMLYAGCTIFSTLLTSAIKTVFLPMIYMYLAVCIADRAIGDAVFSNIKKLLKWLMSWLLKLILYVFTGYIAVSGVVTGSADAISLKATKITLSGMIPVVGGIISDASEAILVGASVLKNSIGVYGILAFFAICIGPVMKILVHSAILKVTGALTGMFSLQEHTGIIEDFSQAMSLLLAATGANCLLLLIASVSFIKGVTI